MKGAVLLRARAELRARARALASLAILAGLIGAAVMTAATGARRTDTAYPRFVRSHLGADLVVYPPFSSEFADVPFDRVAAFPQVAASMRHRLLFVEGNTQLVVTDPAAGRLNIPKIIAGRMPRADSATEAAVSFTLARRRNLHVGSPLVVSVADGQGGHKKLTLRVVGVEATPGEFPPQFGQNTTIAALTIHVSAAVPKSFDLETFDFLLLRLNRGDRDVAAVVDGINALAHGKPALEQPMSGQTRNIERSMHLQSTALWIVAAMIALIGVLVLSQLVARQAGLESAETPTLAALGMTRFQVWAVGMARAIPVALGAGIVGVAVSAAASPLMPIGTARIAEPHPGFSFDPFVAGVGVALIVAGILAMTAWPAWKAARPIAEPASEQLSLPSRVAARQSLPPAVTIGARMALEPGRGRTRVPVRSSLFSVTLAIAGLLAAVTFGASLNHLLSTPRLYGWNWNVYFTSSNEVHDLPRVLAALSADTNLADIAMIDTPPIQLGSLRFDGVALRQVKGRIEPVVLAGRTPSKADEVALGEKTLRDARVHIGSTVSMRVPAVEGPTAVFRVVGTVVLPPISDSSRLGEGGLFTDEGTRRMIAPAAQPPTVTDALIGFTTGTSAADVMRTLRERFGHEYDVLGPARPTDLVNFGQVQSLPLVLAGLVALLAAATLAHTLVTAIRRRRRDLAILKMLGFVPSQVRWTVAWQATTFIAAALVMGIPIGAAAGRVLWTLFASQIGVKPEPVTPYFFVLPIVGGAILLTNALAIAPGILASRLRPAPVLRAE